MHDGRRRVEYPDDAGLLKGSESNCDDLGTVDRNDTFSFMALPNYTVHQIVWTCVLSAP